MRKLLNSLLLLLLRPFERLMDLGVSCIIHHKADAC
jgi:hypothetical protein